MSSNLGLPFYLFSVLLNIILPLTPRSLRLSLTSDVSTKILYVLVDCEEVCSVKLVPNITEKQTISVPSMCSICILPVFVYTWLVLLKLRN